MVTLKDLLSDHQTGHSTFQDDFFITARAGGNLYGQYKQSLRELYRRFRGLRETICDREILLIEIDKEESVINRPGVTFESRKAEVEFRRKSMQLEEADRVIENTYREFCRFYQQAVCLKEHIGELTDERRAELDKGMWMFKIREMIVIDWITKGRIGTSTYEFIHCLPSNLKAEAMTVMQKQNELIHWYEHEVKKEFYTQEDLEKISAPNLPQIGNGIWELLES